MLFRNFESRQLITKCAEFERVQILFVSNPGEIDQADFGLEIKILGLI